MTDLTNQFKARTWCEAADDDADIEQTATFDHVDDVADAALALMQDATKRGRKIQRYGWVLVEGERSDLPPAQSWEVSHD